MKFLISTHFYIRRFLYPLETGHGVWKAREGILIKLESEKGTGFGEVAPIPFFKTETIDQAQVFLNSMGKVVDLGDLQIPETFP
jgi:O-succinylbenzoate synthase